MKCQLFKTPHNICNKFAALPNYSKSHPTFATKIILRECMCQFVAKLICFNVHYNVYLLL